MSLKLLCLGLLGAGTRQAFADLPVHCVRHQVEGEWSFTLGAASDKRSVCGHKHPDTEEAQPARLVVDAAAGVTQLKVTLRSPNVAVTASDAKGNWTMIYDEGFEVNAGDLSFFAFSNYTMETSPSTMEKASKKHPVALMTHEKPHNVSHCGQTMVGWYRNANRTQFGCYYGVKVSPPEAPARKVPQSLAQVATSERARSETGVYEKPLDRTVQRNLVSKINKKLALMQLGWKARAIPRWNGKTMRQVNSYAGIQRGAKTQALRRDMMRQREGPQQEGRSFLQQQQPKKVEAPASKLPKTWDWSDVNGVDYLEPTMDQSECGSCYAASSTRMLTARHKIKLNDTEALPWSINFPLTCSEYNQGCKGGYGFLLAKWSSDVGLLPATCMRYNTSGTCKLECDLKNIGKRYRAANQRYVGSYYGHGSGGAEAMKAELYRNGPMAVGIEPDEDFMFYSEGVYKSAANKTAFLVTDQQWQQVDHGVLLVGWGVEKGQEYWRIQNSWGPDWGEEGFFRIVLGQDEAAIESMAEAADVVEDEQNGKQVDALFAEFGLSSAQTKI